MPYNLVPVENFVMYTFSMIFSQNLDMQCPKLTVHPAPNVHISTAGCTILGGVHPVCARFLSHLLLLYVGRVHEAISGCTDLWGVHPASAQNISLISDTGYAKLHIPT